MKRPALIFDRDFEKDMPTLSFYRRIVFYKRYFSRYAKRYIQGFVHTKKRRAVLRYWKINDIYRRNLFHYWSRQVDWKPIVLRHIKENRGFVAAQMLGIGQCGLQTTWLKAWI